MTQVAKYDVRRRNNVIEVQLEKIRLSHLPWMIPLFHSVEYSENRQWSWGCTMNRRKNGQRLSALGLCGTLAMYSLQTVAGGQSLRMPFRCCL